MFDLTCKNTCTDQETLSALKSGVHEGHLLNKALFKPANLLVLVDSHCLAGATADQAVLLLFVRQSGNAESRLSEVLHVVVHSLVDASQELKALIDASGRNQSIGRSNGRNDVFYDAHRFLIVNALDSVIRCPRLSFLTNPLHVFWAVLVNGSVEMLLPLDD